MSFTDSDLNAFEDGHMRVLAPAYLRRQGKTLLFVSPKKRRPGQSLLLFSAVPLRDSEEADAARRAMEIAKPSTWLGVEKAIVRQGATAWLLNGYELLGADKDAATGLVHHYDLTVVFTRGSQPIQANLMGTGELDQFEHLARSLIQGIEVKGATDESRVEQTRGRTRGLKRAERARLSSALMELPPELGYLREPIQTFAKEDPDSLLAGDADIEPLIKSLRKRAGQATFSPVALRDADALHDWLEALPNHDGAWAAPVSFVEGALRGAALFGDDQS